MAGPTACNTATCYYCRGGVTAAVTRARFVDKTYGRNKIFSYSARRRRPKGRRFGVVAGDGARTRPMFRREIARGPAGASAVRTHENYLIQYTRALCRRGGPPGDANPYAGPRARGMRDGRALYNILCFTVKRVHYAISNVHRARQGSGDGIYERTTVRRRRPREL